MDPNTGDVLACATAPRFDPNTVLDDFVRLQGDRSAPLFDRARLGLYPLGSVFKVVVALAGLESGTLSGQTEFTCTGAFTIGDKTWKCTGVHGTLRLEQAIERSCNSWFYQAGLTVGGERIRNMAIRMGLGRLTDLDLAEAAGLVPLPDSQRELINLSIGGGRLEVTPLQAARLMCVYANCGKLPRPRLDLARPVLLADLGIDPLKLRMVRWGMHDVVMGSSGTARVSGRVPGLVYAAKTGTANLGIEGLYDAWYCGFAPFRTPKIAFAAVIERTQEYGGQAAAPVIRDVFISMLNDQSLRTYLAEEPSDSVEEKGEKQ
jgi:penicillin-binding protein 2